jgi:hypothetical protein
VATRSSTSFKYEDYREPCSASASRVIRRDRNVRIVGEPKAPAELVGKPCEPDPNNRIVPLPADESPGGATDVLFGPVHSDAYECELGCQLGLQIRDRRTPVSFRINLITPLSRPAYANQTFPSIRIAASSSCENTPITVFRFPPFVQNDPTIEGFLFYLVEVQFADGPQWQLSDREAFGKTVTRKWQEERLRPNRSPGR